MLTTALGDAFPDMADDLTRLRPPVDDKTAPLPQTQPHAEAREAEGSGVKKEES
jgi:hypothetical protein